MKQTIFDVANWFLSKSPMTHKKLQRLCYYAEAWSETLLGEPIAQDTVFEAWMHGPVNRNLWEKYVHYEWDEIEQVGSCPSFPSEKEDLLENVWLTYGGLTGTQLEKLVHREDPWRNQRLGLSTFESSHNVIQVKDMVQYYSQIYDPHPMKPHNYYYHSTPVLEEKLCDERNNIHAEKDELCDMDTAIANFKKGIVSDPIELP